MYRRISSVCLIATALFGGREESFGQEPGRLKVTLAGRPRSAFVGQVVDLWIETVGVGDHPKISALRVEGAEVTRRTTERAPADAKDPLNPRARFITHHNVVP